ncbi:MAG TPA: ABC transporter ATP-binding protein [Candidatus Dormibacteraeota bacterium]|nr:ABC transporter ATP-binding protein [Candidatus Dormibacteraeota bacterium]
MRDHLTRVLELAKPYRSRLILGLLCGFLSGALASTLPLSLKLAVDAVFPVKATAVTQPLGSTGTGSTDPKAENKNADKSLSKGVLSRMPTSLQRALDSVSSWARPAGPPSRIRLLLIIAFIPAAMFVRSSLSYLNTYLLSWVAIRAANDLRVRLFRHLVHLPLRFFNRASTGDLMTRIEGAMAVHSTIKDAFGVIIREPVTILVLVVTLVWMQPLLSLFTLLVFPICLIPIALFGRKFRKSDSGIHAKYAGLNNVMQESFTGIRVIKGYNLENLVVAEFQKAVDSITSFFMRAVRAGELPGPLIEFIGSIGVALVFAYYASVSADRAPAGDMLAFFFLVFSMYQPLKNLSRLRHQLELAKMSLDPTYELLSKQTSLPEPANPKPLRAQAMPIQFENVSFSYGEKTVLHNINLTIQPGQMVALVGRTGSGKTSMANLLLRFYDPTAGAILIGDTDIRAVRSHDLRANIAVVTQETILFNDTIRKNIGLGRPGASPAEIEEAAKHAYADGFIRDKPHGYDTVVGEKGVNVSGGQRQRIAIARAILRNAPILILDEATNSLDPEAERIVQDALEELTKNRTTICIAHRLSTIQKADLIVVLDNGRIVETGTHEELLRARGLYCKFYELAFEPPAA